jgi:hypothetical protein
VSACCFFRLLIGVHERAGITQRGGVEQGTGTDSFEQIGLGGFECDETTEDVQQVDQIARVFGQPAIRLDAVERRRRAFIADDGAAAIAPANRSP